MRPATKSDAHWTPWKAAKREGWKFRALGKRRKQWQLVDGQQVVWTSVRDAEHAELPESYRPLGFATLLEQQFFLYAYSDQEDYGSSTKWYRLESTAGPGAIK